MNPLLNEQKIIEKGELGAIFLYSGILDAYEAVGIELIGPNVLNEHVIPKMVYYVKEFLPSVFKFEIKSNDELITNLRKFMLDIRQKIDNARESGSAKEFTMNEIWEIRAAIFGYESVFIDILGDNAIKNYVFKRIADILSAYLPDAFVSADITLKEKLNAFVTYIIENEFVGTASYKIKDNKVQISANRCAFAEIHDSEAYRKANVRFCPWGMIGSAIMTTHLGKETTINSCIFTTKGSVTKIESK